MRSCGMISAETVRVLENPDRNIPYKLGARMHKVNEIKSDVLYRAGG